MLYTRTNGNQVYPGLIFVAPCTTSITGDRYALHEWGTTPNLYDPDVYSFEGLQNGFYDLFVYGIEVGGGEDCLALRETLFLPPGSPGRLVDGQFGGPLEGRNWTSFRIEVSSNSFELRMDGFGAYGQFSGFQLVPTNDPLPLDYEEICLGDGGTAGCTPCPCGNDNLGPVPGGCLNSAQRSAMLYSYESRSTAPQPFDALSVSASPLNFGVDGMAPFAPVMLFSGAVAAPVNPANPCFGTDSGGLSPVFDGLRCASNDIRRHGVVISAHNGDTASPNFIGDDFEVDFAANGFVPGQTRVFQAVYRDSTVAGCGTGLNTTQGIRMTLTP